MKIFSSVLVLGLLLALVAGVTLAQGGPQTPSAPQDMVGYAFTYQGRLTDGGSPANGTYDFEFKLYDAADIGTQVGSTVTVDDVNVSEGLFTVQLDFWCLLGCFTGDARWLEIGVRAGSSGGAYTALSPRQPLTATPYALSLRPGALVSGEALWGLYVENTGSLGYGLVGETKGNSSGDAGVWGDASSSSGEVYGVRGSTESADGYGGYFANDAGGVDIMADGSGIIKSKADSVLYLSPHDMVVRGSSGVSVTPLDNGGADIYYWTGGWKYLSIPVSTFGSLLGSSLYIKSIEVCYKTDSVGRISVTSVIKNNGGTGATNYIYDETDRTSATRACYTVTDSTPAPIDNSTWVQFNVWSDGTGHTYIYTVKLTLTETP